MEKLLEEKGYEVVWQEANHDVKLQNDQIDNMVTQGAKALIIIAEDGDAAATAVDKAAEAGVKVIAYDRLIKIPQHRGYISFNNTEVGRQQALGVMKALDIDGGKWTPRTTPSSLVMLGGSPTDNNAILFRQGQDEDPRAVRRQGHDQDRGRPVGGQLGCRQRPQDHGEHPDRARRTRSMRSWPPMTAPPSARCRRMKAQKLAGIVPISGQDATADGCNSIVKGELTVSILKDIRNLSPLAVDHGRQAAQGQDRSKV